MLSRSAREEDTSGLKIAARADIAPFMAMDVLSKANALAAEGRDVIHLEVGEPAGGAPRKVVQAAHAALERGQLGYIEALGLLDLRRAIAGHYRHMYGLEIEPDRIVVTPGASGGFVLAYLAAFEPGDRVVVPEPAYPCYKNALHALDLEVVRLGLGPETGFRPTPALLDRIDGDVAGLIVASPVNPTGTMLSAGELASIVGYCRDRGIRLISDEIYHGITFEGPAATALASDDRVIVANGFSKYFGMTGWRLGWLVVPDDMTRTFERLAQNLFICPSAISQQAALAAFESYDEAEERVAGYRRNREALLTRLPEIGLGTFAPVDGAFYIYIDVRHLTEDSARFCSLALRETGVALTPGADFDPIEGRHYVRASFAGPHADITGCLDRLGRWLAR